MVFIVKVHVNKKPHPQFYGGEKGCNSPTVSEKQDLNISVRVKFQCQAGSSVSVDPPANGPPLCGEDGIQSWLLDSNWQ